jgi:hypothetical protein
MKGKDDEKRVTGRAYQRLLDLRYKEHSSIKHQSVPPGQEEGGRSTFTFATSMLTIKLHIKVPILDDLCPLNSVQQLNEVKSKSKGIF